MFILTRLIYWFLCCLTLIKSNYSSTATESILKLEDKKSDKEILDFLLDEEKYDKRSLPPTKRPSIINNSLILFMVSSPDETSLKYEVEFLLQQEWYDSRLQHSNTKYDFLNGYYHQGDIWLPDINFHMHGDFKPSQRPIRYTLRIFKDGRVEYATRHHLVINCEGRMNVFPFDNPMCTFSLESISYENSDVKYSWKNNGKTLSKYRYMKTVNANLERNKTFECASVERWRGNFSCLQVDLIFSRDRTFYFATIFIPSFILVTSSFVTFFLDWNAMPARTIIGVTSILNYFTTCNSFRRTLPDVGNLTAMNVWDGVCMCFVYISFLEFIVVNVVARRKTLSKTNSRKISDNNKVSQNKEKWSCTNSLLDNITSNKYKKGKKPSRNPVGIANAIDKIAQIIFPFSFGIFLLIFFVYYHTNSE
ncbi:glutamate-gated chloride channel-like [Adelges cooleyi]|uniref:glutamate-gated chloride channel-like n=1 Tax=Adelges cooleyi TaxID=133065 RepID=UPI002180325F|nr:glutamate-gated chloride channel-like [Adelges cooleyi]